MSEVASKAEPRPMVSVVIASLNGAERIGTAISSALAQSYRDLEIIVVDDGSSPPLRDTVERFDDHRVRMVEHSKNMGVYRSRVDGIAESIGEYVAILDDDDYWLPTKLEAQLEILRREPEIGAVCTGAIDAFPDGTQLVRPPLLGSRNSSRETFELLLVRDRIITSSMVFRRSLYERVGGFDTAFTTTGDWDLWIRMSKEAGIAALKEPLVVTVMREGSLQRSGLDNIQRGYERILEKHRHDIEQRELMRSWKSWYQYSMGIRCLRQGNVQEARVRLRKSFEYRKGFRSLYFLILAMLGIRDIRAVRAAWRSWRNRVVAWQAGTNSRRRS